MLCPHHLLEEPFCSRNIALRAEHEFNGLAFFVHGAIKVLTCFPDLDAGLLSPKVCRPRLRRKTANPGRRESPAGSALNGHLYSRVKSRSVRNGCLRRISPIPLVSTVRRLKTASGSRARR